MGPGRLLPALRHDDCCLYLCLPPTTPPCTHHPALQANKFVHAALFSTLTNVNFDDARFKDEFLHK